VSLYNETIEHLAVLRRAGLRGSRITFSAEGLCRAKGEEPFTNSAFTDAETYMALPYTVEPRQASPVLVHP